MARRLLERKDEVSALIMLDTLCPTIRGGYAIEEMVVAVFNRFADSLGIRSGLDVETLQQVRESERSAFLYDLLVKQGVELPRQKFLASFNVATASEHVCRAYRPSRLTRKLDVRLFKAAEGFDAAPLDYGWGRFLAAPLRAFQIKANHFSIIEKEGAAEIARKMRSPVGKPARRMARTELEVSA
jgi:thioesterase domain-containing protein